MSRNQFENNEPATISAEDAEKLAGQVSAMLPSLAPGYEYAYTKLADGRVEITIKKKDDGTVVPDLTATIDNSSKYPSVHVQGPQDPSATRHWADEEPPKNYPPLEVENTVGLLTEGEQKMFGHRYIV